MKLLLLKSLWGMAGTLEEQFARIDEAGYGGVETGAPAKDRAKEFKALIKAHKFQFNGMIFTNGANAEEHAASLKTQLDALAPYDPFQITVHSARDCWSFDEQCAYFEAALEIEKKRGIPLNHETHRLRAMYTPWTTAALLKKFPALYIAADFSHFTCVCESLLHDQGEALMRCMAHTRHVHGRVGHEEGPQVNDPRAPEWQRHLDAHEAWWKQIVRNRKKSGAKLFTYTPEFGPPNYMPTLPHTRQPVADLWDVCLFMARRFEKLFATVK